MGDLFYFYCFDQGLKTFRVSNHRNYCPEAKRERGHPAVIEYWPSDDSLSKKAVAQVALDELKQIGVIGRSHRPQMIKVESSSGGGFFVPTVKNIQAIDEIRKAVSDSMPTNAVMIGQLATGSTFFLKDILIDAYRKISDR